MGALLRQRAGTDMESYFLAGRKLPGWLNGCSYAATCLNADVAPAYTGMTVITGIVHLLVVSEPVRPRADDRRRALRRALAAAGDHDVAGVLRAALRRRARAWPFGRGSPCAACSSPSSRGPARACSACTRSPSPCSAGDIWTTFAVVVPIILFYVLLSGYVGVVVSDFFQTLVIITASLVAAVGRASGLWRSRRLYQALVTSVGPEVVSWHPPMSPRAAGRCIGVIAWTVGTAVGYGGDTAPMSGAMEGQRILSCRNGREAAKMYVWTQVILFFMLATRSRCRRLARWCGGRGCATGRSTRSWPTACCSATYLPAGPARPGRERHPRVDHVDRQLEHELRRAGVPERRLPAIASSVTPPIATT